MSTPERQDRSEHREPSSEEHLRLAEESDGSTHPVPADSSSEKSEKPGRSSSRSSPSKSGRAEDSAASSPSASKSESGEGTSTGGFETVLGKLVVESGLVTPDEVEMCNSLLRDANRESAGDEPGRTLTDLLIENEFVTPRQLQRLRSEFEAKKSSQRIPGYKIIRKVGSGAMATVFLAKQLSLDRKVAIKVLPRKFSDNKKFIDRFYKEGRAAAQLNHPNIVSAYDVGQAGEHHYFVMEYVDGETVYDRVVSEKRIDEKEAIRIVRQVAEALKHAHDKGFIHRDIKPKNIMISKSGIVKLADLGLARAVSDVQAAKAEAGRAYGTPYYISPEQIRGEVKIGPPADIYGLGATFYHMVTGRVPFEGKNPSAVMHKHLKSELTPPDHINPKLSAGCAQVIEMMMAKDPKSRYRNVEDLITDLELIENGQSPRFAKGALNIPEFVPAKPQEPGVRPGQPIAQRQTSLTENPAFMGVLLALIVSLIANAVLIFILVT